MAYYRRIRDMREDHDLTQRQLASILKMPQSLYNRYEQGLRDIPTVTLIQLAPPARPILGFAHALLGAVEQVDLVQSGTLAQLHDLDTEVPHGLGGAGMLHAL